MYVEAIAEAITSSAALRLARAASYEAAAESSSEVWDVKRDPKVDVAIGAPGSPDRLAMQADVMPDPAWVPQMVDLLKKKYGAKHADRMARTAESAKGGHVVIKLKPV